MGNKVRAGRYMMNVVDRSNPVYVEYFTYDEWHRDAKYSIRANVHFGEVRLVDDSAETAATYIVAWQYILNNQKKSFGLSWANPMTHYDNKEYDIQRDLKASLELPDDVELDNDDYYDTDDIQSGKW
jgi:hypothetical protein